MEKFKEELEAVLSGKKVPSHILKSVTCQWPEDGHPKRAVADFYYLGLRDGVPLVNEFCGALRAFLIYFCLPSSDIAEARSQYLEENQDEAVWFDLWDKARALFIRAQKKIKSEGRSGEGGELILFALLEHLGAPQVVSKMYLKTASQMPVHGSDGLHLQADAEGDSLFVYIGESKLQARFSSALDDALKSVRKLTADDKKERREYELITDHIDTDFLSDEFVSTLSDYLNPYKEDYIKTKQAHACLLGFNSAVYRQAGRDPKTADVVLSEKMKKLADRKLKLIAKKLADEPYSRVNFSFLLLPFESVEQFREKFQSIVLGSENA